MTDEFSVSCNEDENNPYNWKMFDFTDNSAWFDRKLLISIGTDFDKSISPRSYQNKLKKLFKKVGVHSKHYGHFGRHVAPVFCEFKELDPETIRQLGEWCCCCCFFSFLFLTFIIIFYRELGP